MGESFEGICQHNSQVAEAIGKQQIAYSWRILSLLCANSDLVQARPTMITNNYLKNIFATKNSTSRHTSAGKALVITI